MPPAIIAWRAESTKRRSFATRPRIERITVSAASPNDTRSIAIPKSM
jgi:hypothetical protein